MACIVATSIQVDEDKKGHIPFEICCMEQSFEDQKLLWKGKGLGWDEKLLVPYTLTIRIRTPT